MLTKLIIFLFNLAFVILAVAVSSLWLYLIGILVVLLAKLAILWDESNNISFKTIFITFILSITGGYIGYLVGLQLFPNHDMKRLLVLLVSIYLGDIILIGLKKQSPELLKKLLTGVLGAGLKKLGGEDNKEN